jgi:hypothetical protein
LSVITYLQHQPASSQRKGPFTFLKARYIVELTGRKARNLREFGSILASAEPSSLFYHVYHPLFEAHLVPYEYPNDFSYWLADSIQDKELAEQIANIALPERGGLEELREILLSKIEPAASHSDSFEVRSGNEFDFVRCRFVVFPTGTVAKNLDDLADGISLASELCVFYHLVTSRLFKKSRYDDFSEWIIANTDEEDLAEQIRRVDPTTHMNVRSMQKEVVGITQRYLKRKHALSAPSKERKEVAY